MVLFLPEANNWIYNKTLNIFQTAHGKSYSCAAEEALRMSIFFEKVAQIDQHNARFEGGAESFKMAINKFSDMVSCHRNSRL